MPVINGGYDVWEAFTEFNLPLWASGPRRLELDLAARYSDYSTSGGINSHKTGLNFQVAEPIRLRATVSRDVREPTFAERFNLQGGGGNIQDPMFGGNTFEITVTSGGNPDLDPEIADTTTMGIVIQPKKLPGLQFSIDGYDIDVSGAVGQLNQQRIVNECAAGNAALCALITRDPNTHVVTNVRNVFLNINKARVRGIDYELLWNTTPNWFKSQEEALSLRFLAGRLLEDSTTVPGSAPLDLAGQFDEPDLTAVATARYQIGKWGVNLQQRYIAPSVLSVQNYVQFAPGVVPGPNQFTIDDNTVQSKMYTDLTVSYEHPLNGGHSWDLSLAVTNLLDADPPVIAYFDQRFSAQYAIGGGGQSGNNFDVYGRRFLLTFRYRM